MLTDDHPFILMVDKLAEHTPIDDEARASIYALPYRRMIMDGGAYLIREGQKTDSCHVCISGLAYRSRTAFNGSRQIVSVHLRGEMLDVQDSILPVASCSLQALSRLDVAVISRKSILEIAEHFPSVGRALWSATLRDLSGAREWMTNLGRRNARQRVSHFICEMAVRQRSATMIVGNDVFWPFTQEQVADIVGLTPVHVNRTLKSLRLEGAVSPGRDFLTINNWDTLRSEGDFSSGYLH